MPPLDNKASNLTTALRRLLLQGNTEFYCFTVLLLFFFFFCCCCFCFSAQDIFQFLGVFVSELVIEHLAREPAVCLFMLLRPKGLKACSEAEKYAEFKNRSLRKIRQYTNWLYANEYPRHDPF